MIPPRLPRHPRRSLVGFSAAQLAQTARGGLRYALARATGTDAWISVVLLVTMRCNLRCGYCDFPRQRPEHELSTKQVFTLLEQLRRMGTVRLSLSGGEPLLREDLGAICTRARELGFITSVVTNGTLLAERHRDVQAADYLFCTLEGTPGVHARERGEGSWRRVVEELKTLGGSGRPRLGLIFPVHRGNTESLEAVTDLAEELSLKVFFQPVQERPGWRGPRFNGYLDQQAISAAFSRILRWKQRGRPVGNSSYYLRLMSSGLWPEAAGSCLAGRFFLTILPDGSVRSCCMVPLDGPGVPLSDYIATRGLYRFPRIQRPGCAGCAISPYLESQRILQLDWRTLLNALRI